MNPSTLPGRLLLALFRRSQCNENIDVFELASDCRVSVLGVLKCLSALERAGLAYGRRQRLTLEGLAVAASLARGQRAPAEGAIRHERSRAKQPSPRHAA